MTYSEFKQALLLFELHDGFTMAQFKSKHRELLKLHHPDAVPQAAGTEMIEQINAAYKIIADFVSNYRFSCSEEEFYRQNPEEQLRRQFMEDPVWGNGWRK